MNNDNYTRFEYNMMYKYWCFNQLISSFDRIDDIVLIMKKKLCQILKMRKFTVPDSIELNDGLGNNRISHVFINPDGIVFRSKYVKGLEDTVIKFEYVNINYLFGNGNGFLLSIYYISENGYNYYFYIDTALSHIDIDTIMCDNRIISCNRQYFDKRCVGHYPEFIAF